MIIKKLNITGLRAYTQAEFEFQPGMNLLVGINGVGKTTVLEALRICLSRILPVITASKNRRERLSVSDIKIGKDTLQVACEFSIEGTSFNLLIHQQKEPVKRKESDDLTDPVIETPDKETITPSLKKIFPDSYKAPRQPVGIFFSTKRSLITDKQPGKSTAAGQQAAAFAESLSENREFNLKIFAEWFNVQQALSKEDPSALKNIEILKAAVHQFLPEFSDLKVDENDEQAAFTVEKSGTILNASQLSDGERGMLALVLDIARRLSQANPGLEFPLKDGKGIILIDEIDLHLHPQWQRSIVENLTRVFPNCQFIATTHSPQIIGEVKPGAITIIDTHTHRPTSSYGIDSSRVLEEILETPSRTKKVDTLLASLYKSIDEEKLNQAKKQIAELKTILGPDDPEVARSSTMITFLEDDLTNETDKEK